MVKELTLEQYQTLVEEQGQGLLDFLAYAATGDLDREIEVPSGIDVFTDLAIGLSYLIDDLRSLVQKEREAQATLEQRVVERTQELESALAEVRAVQRRYIEREWSVYVGDAILGDAHMPAAWAPAVETAVLHQQTALLTNTETALAVPVRYADEVLGVMGFGNEANLVDWGESEITAVEAIVEQVGFALENQRLFDQTQAALAETEEQARRLALLNEMGAALNTATQTEEVYKIAGDHALKIIGGDRASISIINETNSTFQMIPLSGQQGPPIGSGQHIPLAGTVMGEVVRLRRLVVLPDKSLGLNDSVEQEFIKMGFVSSMIAPLLVGDQVIGALNVGSKQAQVYGPNSVSLMRQVTTLVTTTLENQRLFNETQTRAEQLAAINQLAQAISQQLDRDQLLSTVNEQIRRIMPADSFIVALYDADTNQVSYPYINESGDVSQSPAMSLNPKSYIAQVVTSRQAALHHLTQEEVADIALQNTTVHLGDDTKPSSASLIFAPLQIGSRVTGAVSVQSYAYNAYTHADVTLLSGVANNIAVALENVRLFTETQQRAAQLQTLSSIEVALSQANTEEEIVSALVMAFAQDPELIVSLSYLTPYPTTGVIMNSIETVWFDGNFIPPELISPFQNASVETFALTRLWRANPNQFLFIADVNQDLRVDEAVLAEAAQQSWQAALLLPLQGGGQWQALVSFNWRRPRTLTPDEAFLVDRLIEPVAAVIATRRAQLAQQEALTETEALYTAGAELNAAQTLDDVLAAIRRHTVAGQNAQIVSLNYFDRPWTEQELPEWIEVVAHYNELPADTVLARYPLAAFPAAQTMLRPDAATAVDDIATTPNLDEGSRTLYMQQFGAKSTIFVPLVVAGRWVGYINAIYQQTTLFSEKDVRRLMALAGQATVAMQNIQLLQETARKARREQLLREITAQVRSSADVDTIMKTAVQEIGQALGRRTYIYVGSEEESPANAPQAKKGTSNLTDQYGA